MWTGSMRRAWLAGVAVALVLPGPATGTFAHRGQAKVNKDAQIGAEFLKRVEQHVDLHNKLERTLPDMPKQPTVGQVESHQNALARLMADARRGAKHGDLFTSDCRAYFRRQIARALGGPDGAEIRQSIMEENPGPITIRINGRYPDTVPVSSVPPQVLAALPRLPDDVEYRFIGKRLILLDIHSNLIVDYIDDALPR
jgi:hypothetical protein